MGAWYVGTVWALGTCGGRDSGVVGSYVRTFVRASNVKGLGAIGATGCAIGGVDVGAARGEFRRNPYSCGLIRSLRELAEKQPGDHGVLVVVFRV